MPTATTRLQFRGRIRAEISYSIKLITRVLKFNSNYNVDPFQFLTPAEVIAAQTYQTALVAALAARIPKT